MKKSITRINLLSFLLVLVVMMLPALAMAQPGFGDDVSDVPLDGGLSLLVAAGVGYGAKKMHQKRKQKSN